MSDGASREERRASAVRAESAPSLIRTISAKSDSALSDDALKALELNHRIKNILSVVQSLANQTLRGEVTLEAARQSLGDRLVAMGHAVDLLIGNDWQPAAIDAILDCALIHRSRFGERLSLDGPRVEIGAGAAMNLTMAIQELESNAIKYGALSSEKGRISIVWRLSAVDGRDWLRLEWREEAGPPVLPAVRQGFGTRLLAAVIGRRLGGRAELDYRSEGVRWLLDVPADGLLS